MALIITLTVKYVIKPYTAIARVFVKGGTLASAEGTSLVEGSGGILLPKIFKFEGYFRHLS